MQLARWFWLDRQSRLVSFDYPYRPRSRDWSGVPAMQRLAALIARGEAAYAAELDGFARLAAAYAEIPLHRPEEAGTGPNWTNGWFPPVDAISLTGLLATRAPRTYYEVGSGNSTRFARWAVQRFGLATRIVSIDPHPRAEIDALCDEVVRRPFEDVAEALRDRLTGDDMLFIDNSHRAFPGSDVTVFFMESLGSLPAGLLYGLHDICLPFDYPADWNARFYNEQYLLGAYLLGGAGGDALVLPNAYVRATPHLLARLDPVWREPRLAGIGTGGSAFWMRASTKD
jgi:hypothetical protein